MRYFFHIAYNGHTYSGWQRQPKVNSVQEVIETKLSQIFKTPLTINGCGRTDSGVHVNANSLWLLVWRAYAMG